jgi:isoleucyl-tRNA synthetase
VWRQAVASWFVKVEAIKERLLANNAQTYWVPTYVKEKRFHNWLENAHDWAVSRTRFWGTPLPIWTSEDGKEIVVVGSLAELQQLTGEKVHGTALGNVFSMAFWQPVGLSVWLSGWLCHCLAGCLAGWMDGCLLG